MRKAVKAAALVLGSVLLGMIAGCNGGAPDGATEIKFLYGADMFDNSTYQKLAKTYNDTKGKEDGVYVRPYMTFNVGSSRNTYVGECDSNVVLFDDDSSFKDIAVDDLFLDLTQYATESNVDFSKYAEGSLNFARLTIGTNGAKTLAGEGQNLIAMPFSSTPKTLYYNKNYFSELDINVISATEAQLKTDAKYSKIKPHGYAEYAASYGAPYEGAVLSTNIRGESVYKVFNNKVPMNWEEQRVLAKMFTSSYHQNDFNCTYGFANEHWFTFAWSVGGDVIGWNGENYDFTLMDKTANWLTTKAVTINGKEYAAGEVVSYEDKIKVGEAGMAAIDGIHRLPSQYDAQTEFLPYNIPRGKTIDAGVTGYGVASTDHAVAGLFMSGTAAMAYDQFDSYKAIERTMKSNFDIAPVAQHREYAGGSIYFDGEGTALENQFLKVIGNTYDNQVYTGELAVENDTPLVGRSTTLARNSYLVIPKNSDPEKYDAAWSFLSWATGSEGQKIFAEATCAIPAHSDAYNVFLEKHGGRDLSVLTSVAKNVEIGDWAYFENGEWVTDWSDDYNDSVRNGTMTITNFLAARTEAAQKACANTSIIIKGRF